MFGLVVDLTAKFNRVTKFSVDTAKMPGCIFLAWDTRIYMRKAEAATTTQGDDDDDEAMAADVVMPGSDELLEVLGMLLSVLQSGGKVLLYGFSPGFATSCFAGGKTFLWGGRRSDFSVFNLFRIPRLSPKVLAGLFLHLFPRLMFGPFFKINLTSVSV